MTNEERAERREALTHVYNVLNDAGYNAVNQLIGYLVSDDVSYITTKQDARIVIRKYDRDEVSGMCDFEGICIFEDCEECDKEHPTECPNWVIMVAEVLGD